MDYEKSLLCLITDQNQYNKELFVLKFLERADLRILFSRNCCNHLSYIRESLKSEVLSLNLRPNLVSIEQKYHYYMVASYEN